MSQGLLDASLAPSTDSHVSISQIPWGLGAAEGFKSNFIACRAVGQARGLRADELRMSRGDHGSQGPACAWCSAAMCGFKPRYTQRAGGARSTGSLPQGTHPAPELGVQLADEVKEPLAGDQEAVAGNSDRSSVNRGALPSSLGKNVKVKSDDTDDRARGLEAVKLCGNENHTEVCAPPPPPLVTQVSGLLGRCVPGNWEQCLPRRMSFLGQAPRYLGLRSPASPWLPACRNVQLS